MVLISITSNGQSRNVVSWVLESYVMDKIPHLTEAYLSPNEGTNLK